MFLWWVCVAFILQHLQCCNQFGACMARLDDLIDIAAAGCYIRAGELFSVLRRQLLASLLRIIGSFNLIFKKNIHRAFWSHNSGLGSWPGVIDIAAHMLAIHHVIGSAVSLARNDGNFGNSGLTVSVE